MAVYQNFKCMSLCSSSAPVWKLSYRKNRHIQRSVLKDVCCSAVYIAGGAEGERESQRDREAARQGRKGRKEKEKDKGRKSLVLSLIEERLNDRVAPKL